MRARVLFLAGNLDLGGAEMVLRTLARVVDRTRFEPHIGLVDNRGSFLDDVASDVVIHDLHCWRSRYASIPIARLCWKLRPAAVLSSAAHLNSALILAKPLLPPKTRVLVRESANITLPGVSTPLRRFFCRQLYRSADMVICQSRLMMRQMETDFQLPRSRLTYIYNPVDIATIRRNAEASSNPYTGRKPHLVAVGRLAFPKGFDLLLAAMPLIQRQIPGADLTIVGDGPQGPELRALQSQLGLQSEVVFTGLLRNPFGLMKHADLVVIPSRFDALPNVALEAIALGKPVVATACPGAITEIAETTSRIRIVPELSADAMALEITRALVDRTWMRNDDPAPEFLRRFSVAAVMPQFERLFAHESALPDVSLAPSVTEHHA